MPATSPLADPIASALSDIRRLRKSMGVKSKARVKSQEQRDQLKSVALAWFQNYKPKMLSARLLLDVTRIDFGFRQILMAAERSLTVAKIQSISKQLERDLVVVHTESITSPPIVVVASEAPPTFSSVPDPVMREILTRRWRECVSCLTAEAPLAATVMMGGLLEALFLGRVNREPNKQLVFTAASAPRDLKTQNTLPLKQWTLKDYIAVAHDLGWIPQAVHDVSQILRDYRNYIHPQKEFSSQLALSIGDAQMLWSVCKAITSHIS